MRTRAEIVLRWTAAVAPLTLASIGAAAGGVQAAAWAMIGLIYITGPRPGWG